MKAEEENVSIAPQIDNSSPKSVSILRKWSALILVIFMLGALASPLIIYQANRTKNNESIPNSEINKDGKQPERAGIELVPATPVHKPVQTPKPFVEYTEIEPVIPWTQIPDEILNPTPAPTVTTEKEYNGFSVMKWTDGDYEGETTYYTVYDNAYEKDGAPTFYCENRDQYNNIYSGWDVKITFFRPYDGATPEKAASLVQYLEENSTEKDHCAGSYYFEDDDIVTAVYVWLIEGWDLWEPSMDLQELWDRNIWMNCDATGLILENLGYADTEGLWAHAYIDLGCSTTVTVQKDERSGFPGIVVGFHFIEGTDDHVVKRYCRDETW